MIADSKILYLFSSNQSRLYEQDILDVLAAPRGTLRQFRYFERYVSPTLRNHLDELEGRSALIHFSLQQEEQYHEPVVIPVRWARIYSASLIGDVYAFQLCMEDWCSIAAPRDEGSPTFRDWQKKRDLVHQYQQWLSDSNVEHPYAWSAGVGPDLRGTAAPLESTSDDALLFNYCAQYLQSTRSFTAARFYRVRTVRKLARGSVVDDVHADPDGAFAIEGGHTYSLQVSHFQPATPQSIDRVAVEADGKSITVVGRALIEIASRYDDVAIEFFAAEPATAEARDSVVILEPQGATFAAKVRLRFRVARPTSRTLAAVGGAALAAILLGIPTLWTTLSPTWKALSVLSAALLTALLANAGLKRS